MTIRGRISVMLLGVMGTLLFSGCESPLHYAAVSSDINTVKELLDKGAEVNEQNALDGSTALQAAGSAGRVDTVNLLLDKGANINKAIAGLRRGFEFQTGDAIKLLNELQRNGTTPAVATVPQKVYVPPAPLPVTPADRAARRATDIENAKAAASRDPLNWRVFNELGVVYHGPGMYDQAIAAFQQALALHPVTTTIEFVLG